MYSAKWGPTLCGGRALGHSAAYTASVRFTPVAATYSGPAAACHLTSATSAMKQAELNRAVAGRLGAVVMLAPLAAAMGTTQTCDAVSSRSAAAILFASPAAAMPLAAVIYAAGSNILAAQMLTQDTISCMSFAQACASKHPGSAPILLAAPAAPMADTEQKPIDGFVGTSRILALFCRPVGPAESSGATSRFGASLPSTDSTACGNTSCAVYQDCRF
eukprot:gene10832-biopygen259